MVSVAVIIPVKARDPKSRLASVLNVKQRRQLLVAMLEDVLQAVMKARLIHSTRVVSSDQEILKFAERYGAEGVEERENRGGNAAVRSGIKETRQFGASLIIPADIPFLDAKDVRNVITLYGLGASVVVSPSEALDGTNLLMIKRGTPFELHYDDDSFRKHTKEAVERGIPVSMYYSQSVAFDIDTSRDLYRVFKMPRRCSTMTFLGRVMGKTRLKQSMQRDENSRTGREL
jgi:2-phospho-L-lactate guanylyltransferase